MHLTHRTSGLTLIELVITLSIAAILLAAAAPSFSGIIKNNKMTTQLNELVAGLNLARSESIKRASPVTVCKSSDGASCGGNWNNGWIVFPDLDNSGSVTNSEAVLREYVPPKNGAILSSISDEIIFDAEGYSVNYSNKTFLLCDDRGDSNRKGLVTSNTGRVRTAQTSELSSC